jgi:large exoprotein involved in heme utilization and adhesion
MRQPRILWRAYFSNVLHGALCKVGYGILAAVAFQPEIAHALPQGGQVSGGQAGIVTGANQVTINQSSQRAVLDWNSFNVGSDESVRFNQPSASAIALNRIHDANPSQVDGQLTANGQVWLYLTRP